MAQLGKKKKEFAYNAGDLGSIPELGRSPGVRGKLPNPVFWPGEFHGLCSLWGLKEPDTAEQLSLSGARTFQSMTRVP